MYEFNWQGCSYEVSQAPVLGDQVIALPGGTIVHPFMNNPIACRIEVSSAHPGKGSKGSRCSCSLTSLTQIAAGNIWRLFVFLDAKLTKCYLAIAS